MKFVKTLKKELYNRKKQRETMSEISK